MGVLVLIILFLLKKCWLIMLLKGEIRVVFFIFIFSDLRVVCILLIWVLVILRFVLVLFSCCVDFSFFLINDVVFLLFILVSLRLVFVCLSEVWSLCFLVLRCWIFWWVRIFFLFIILFFLISNVLICFVILNESEVVCGDLISLKILIGVLKFDWILIVLVDIVMGIFVFGVCVVLLSFVVIKRMINVVVKMVIVIISESLLFLEGVVVVVIIFFLISLVFVLGYICIFIVLC